MIPSITDIVNVKKSAKKNTVRVPATNEPSGPHNHQNLHLTRAFPFRKTARVNVGPKHTTNGGGLLRGRRRNFLRGCDERPIGDLSSLPLASLHGEQALGTKFLGESVDLFLPPLRNWLSGTK